MYFTWHFKVIRSHRRSIGLKPKKFGPIWVDLGNDLLARLIELGQGLTHSNLSKMIPKDDLTSNEAMEGH